MFVAKEDPNTIDPDSIIESPLTRSSDPEDSPLDVDILNEPLFNVDEPDANDTEPPSFIDELPDENLIFPYRAIELPATILIEPPTPFKAADVCTTTVPLLPLFARPDRIVKLPLVPEDPALLLNTLKAPLLVSTPLPEATEMLPPILSDAVPERTTTRPPEP